MFGHFSTLRMKGLHLKFPEIQKHLNWIELKNCIVSSKYYGIQNDMINKLVE